MCLYPIILGGKQIILKKTKFEYDNDQKTRALSFVCIKSIPINVHLSGNFRAKLRLAESCKRVQRGGLCLQRIEVKQQGIGCSSGVVRSRRGSQHLRLNLFLLKFLLFISACPESAPIRGHPARCSEKAGGRGCCLLTAPISAPPSRRNGLWQIWW